MQTYTPEQKDLLRRAHLARVAIKYHSLDPYVGLLWTVKPELFERVPEVRAA